MKLEKLVKEIQILDKKLKDLKKHKSVLTSLETSYQKVIDSKKEEIQELDIEIKETSADLDEVYVPSTEL